MNFANPLKKKESKEQDLELTRKEIENLGLEAIKNYFKVDVKGLSPEVTKELHKKAKLGMSFEREMGIRERAVEMNYLRVFKIVSEDKEELKKLIKQTLPKYYK